MGVIGNQRFIGKIKDTASLLLFLGGLTFVAINLLNPWLLSAVLLASLSLMPQSVPAFPSAPEQEAGSTTSISETTEATGEVLLSNIRQVTFEGKRAGEGYFNRDGSRMVFQSEREEGNPFYQIYLLDLLKGETHRVSPGVGKTTCAWIHPTEEKVLFASTHEDDAAKTKQEQELADRASGKERRYSWDYDLHYDLFECGMDGAGSRNLTRTLGYDAEGSWSPDGRTIVFASNREAYNRELNDDEKKKLETDPSYFIDLYSMDADGSNVRRLTEAPGYDGGPFFSADGTKICWRRFSEDGVQAEVWVMKADGSEPRPITRLDAMSWAPFFHPTGDYLIFTTNLHGFGNFELYIVDVDGRSKPVRVTYTPGFDGLPVFTPDGKTLAWTCQRNSAKQSQIYFAAWDDAGARKALGLLPIAADAVSPSTLSGDSWLAAIDENDIRSHVEFLASDLLNGRLTGTMGEKMATEYVASQFKALGLEPAGDGGTFFQEFEFTAGVSLGAKNHLSWKISGQESATFTPNEEWRPISFSTGGEIPEAGVVFAGYGMVAPAEDGFEEYDSFVHLDVKGKWVMVFRFMPEGISPEARRRFLRFSSLRYKTMVLRGKGAKGVIFVSGPNAAVKDQLADLSPDASFSTSGMAAVSVTDAVAQKILEGAGKNLKELQTALDGGDLAMGFEIPDATLSAAIDIVGERRTGRNVLGRWKGNGARVGETVVLGAHVDHLGQGDGSTSLARENERGKVHPGADDNASGVAAMIEIAEAIQSASESAGLPARDILFAAWSGEEMGLLGSTHFTKAFASSIGSATRISPAIAAALNLDMVGRLKDSLVLQGFGSSSVWAGLVESANASVGLNIQTSNESYLPTDATQFYLRGVPILSAFTGAHEEYHSPRDTPDRLNMQGLRSISELMARILWAVANRPESPPYYEMKKPDELGTRAALRAYLGTIPDYSQEETLGVLLAGVAKGGPADKSGVRQGDIITSLAGQAVQNIYDYTYAIEALKVGEPVEIKVKRGSEEIAIKITPESRE